MDCRRSKLSCRSELRAARDLMTTELEWARCERKHRHDTYHSKRQVNARTNLEMRMRQRNAKRLAEHSNAETLHEHQRQNLSDQHSNDLNTRRELN
jgi:hypothetical protein